MVATSGRGWQLAPSLVLLVAETDRIFPDRDHASDGSIGDAAHASRTSDHNPYDGWVHAVDLDEDLAPGLDLSGFVAAVVARQDPRVRYLIYEGQIIKSYVDPAGRPPWKWQPYTGPNPHTRHAHISINRTATARTDLRSWWAKPAPSKVHVIEESTTMVIEHANNGWRILLADAGPVYACPPTPGRLLRVPDAVLPQSAWDRLVKDLELHERLVRLG